MLRYDLDSITYYACFLQHTSKKIHLVLFHMNILLNRNKRIHFAYKSLALKMCQRLIIESQKYLIFFQLCCQLVLLIPALKRKFTTSQVLDWSPVV